MIPREVAIKKSLISAVAVLVFGYPTIAWLAGYAIERRIHDATAALQTQAPFLTVTDSRYHRGWYVSEETLDVDAFHGGFPAGLPLPGGATPNPAVKALHFTIHSVIHHGPICGSGCFGLAQIDTEFTAAPQLHAVLAKLYGTVDPIQIRSRLGFFGGGSTTLTNPPFHDVALEGKGRLSWDGFTLTAEHSGAFDSLAIHAAAPGARYLGADGAHAELAELSFDANSHRALRSLYTGTGVFSVRRLAVAGVAGNGSFSMDGMRVASNSSASDDYMTMSALTGAGPIAMAAITLSGVHFDFTFRHLEMESLESLTAAIRRANQDAAVSPAVRAANMLAVFKTQGMQLLVHQPEIGVDRVSAATSAGEALLTGVVRLRDVGPADIADGADPKALLRKIEAEFDLSIDDALLASLPGGGAMESKLQAFAQLGMVTRANGKSRSKISIRQGGLTFNGKPFQLGGPSPGGTPQGGPQPGSSNSGGIQPANARLGAGHATT